MAVAVMTSAGMLRAPLDGSRGVPKLLWAATAIQGPLARTHHLYSPCCSCRRKSTSDTWRRLMRSVSVEKVLWLVVVVVDRARSIWHTLDVSLGDTHVIEDVKHM
jgi:hypothetical protein